MLRQGDRIADWIVETPLGEGGMGAVYRVHSALTQRLVAALKVMKPSAEADARARFVREAEALSALRHPAIVRVMGFSEDPDHGLLYLVMELAEGETLRERLASSAMSLPEALGTFGPLASALDHAHGPASSTATSSPSNVILARTDRAWWTSGSPPAPRAGAHDRVQLGTLAYLPPEVFRGERAEPPAMDVYAFGLLLHEALTGSRGFAVRAGLAAEEAAQDIAERKRWRGPFDPGERFPHRLREVVRSATHPHPAWRPPMREVRASLDSLQERRASLTVAVPRGGLLHRQAVAEAPGGAIPLVGDAPAPKVT